MSRASYPQLSPPSGALLRCDLDLPQNYRQADMLTFHQRDQLAVAERVEPSMLQKGICWDGVPACLTLTFEAGRVLASLQLEGMPEGQSLPEAQSVSGVQSPAEERRQIRFERMVRRMLGLTQPVEAFEQAYAQHPVLGPLIRRRPGLRVAMTATPFEALTWAIIGQQISVSAAVSIRRRLIIAADMTHGSGLLCYPGAEQVLAMPDETLLQAGFSRSKAQTIRGLSEAVVQQRLPLDLWLEELDAEMVAEQLTALKGIGPWTVSYALLRGFGWLDGSLHGDVAVRRNLQTLLGREEKLSQEEVRRWLADYSPWRALVGAHLWAMQASDGY